MILSASGVAVMNGYMLFPPVRFWMQKAKVVFEKQWEEDPEALEKVLAIAENEIFPDNVLKNVVDAQLMSAIKGEILQRCERQSCYLIRAWLGIDMVCPNVWSLEVSAVWSFRR